MYLALASKLYNLRVTQVIMVLKPLGTDEFCKCMAWLEFLKKSLADLEMPVS